MTMLLVLIILRNKMSCAHNTFLHSGPQQICFFASIFLSFCFLFSLVICSMQWGGGGCSMKEFCGCKFEQRWVLTEPIEVGKFPRKNVALMTMRLFKAKCLNEGALTTYCSYEFLGRFLHYLTKYPIQ